MVLVHVDNDELTIRIFLDRKDTKKTNFRFSIMKEGKLVHSIDKIFDLKQDEYLILEILQLDTWTLDDPMLYDFEISMDA